MKINPHVAYPFGFWNLCDKPTMCDFLTYVNSFQSVILNWCSLQYTPYTMGLEKRVCTLSQPPHRSWRVVYMHKQHIQDLTFKSVHNSGVAISPMFTHSDCLQHRTFRPVFTHKYVQLAHFHLRAADYDRHSLHAGVFQTVFPATTCSWTAYTVIHKTCAHVLTQPMLWNVGIPFHTPPPSGICASSSLCPQPFPLVWQKNKSGILKLRCW